MIIQVCGTNGSGKSTVVRSVIAKSEEMLVIQRHGKEYGSLRRTAGVLDPVCIVGRYGDKTTAGCDTIKDVKSVLPFIAEQHAAGVHVLFEGIRMMGHTDGIAFSKQVGPQKMVTVLLTTTLEECLEGIRALQVANYGVATAVSKDVESTITRARNYCYKLSELGVRKVLAKRDEAPEVILQLLRGER